MSSFYDLASLVMIPSGKKAGKVYSQKPLTTDGQLDFTRASTATRIGSDGKIEKTRTNNLLYSNDFNTGFSKTRASMVSGQSGYDGTNDAWSFVDTSDNSTHLIVQTVASSEVQTFSVYAKAGAVNFIVFRYEDSTVDYVYFDLANGILGTIDSDYITAKITSVGNGWYRCEAARTSANKVVILSAQSDNDPTYAGAGTAALYIQDAQLEPGLVATNYIETTSSAVSVGSVDNMPRLNYTMGSATSCPSLLLEPQRSNLIASSEYFDAWNKNNAIITTNAIISPEGVDNATKLIGTSGTNDKFVREFITYSASAYSFSVYAKQGEANWLQFIIYDGSNHFGYFNLANGVLGSQDAGFTSTMTDVGNGWYKIEVIFTTAAFSGQWKIMLSDGDGSVNFTGNGTDGLYLYGAQVEAGSYATSYIPTFGATVTRVPDACSKTGITSLIGQTEGTAYIKFNVTRPIDGTTRILTISNGTGNERIGISMSTNVMYAFIVDGGVTQAEITISGAPSGLYKAAIAYKNNDVTFYINGTQIGTDTSATMPTTDQIELGAQFGAGILGDGIDQTILFKTRLSNTQLAELTSLDS